MHRLIDDQAIEQSRLADLQDAEELLAKARQYLSLLDHAEDMFKHYHELLDFAEGTAGDNKGRPWDWIERAKAVVYKAEGNT